ncbi:MAG TPA: DUF2914 domain-containing protein [Polyangiaceae bacterium]|nr:DUF2914 domain-containing protein [Polyangiaceae bacterium]
MRPGLVGSARACGPFDTGCGAETTIAPKKVGKEPDFRVARGLLKGWGNRRFRPVEDLNMTGIENSRWVAVSALAAAMFAVGFSFAGVACNHAPDLSVAEAARAADSVSVPAPSASLGRIAKIVNGAPSALAVSTATPSRPHDERTNAETTVGSDGLKLKRFVVTHKIEGREPVAGDQFKLGSTPVYAFVEFENSARDARSVRVLFQNEDTKATVGHVKLTVPGASERFRTWGNTRLIRDPGHWVAVVSTLDGVELGRAKFEVGA